MDVPNETSLCKMLNFRFTDDYSALSSQIKEALSKRNIELTDIYLVIRMVKFYVAFKDRIIKRDKFSEYVEYLQFICKIIMSLVLKLPKIVESFPNLKKRGDEITDQLKALFNGQCSEYSNHVYESINELYNKSQLENVSTNNKFKEVVKSSNLSDCQSSNHSKFNFKY